MSTDTEELPSLLLLLKNHKKGFNANVEENRTYANSGIQVYVGLGPYVFPPPVCNLKAWGPNLPSEPSSPESNLPFNSVELCFIHFQLNTPLSCIQILRAFSKLALYLRECWASQCLNQRTNDVIQLNSDGP